jgi:hypothetical protein
MRNKKIEKEKSKSTSSSLKIGKLSQVEWRHCGFRSQTRSEVPPFATLRSSSPHLPWKLPQPTHPPFLNSITSTHLLTMADDTVSAPVGDNDRAEQIDSKSEKVTVSDDKTTGKHRLNHIHSSLFLSYNTVPRPGPPIFVRQPLISIFLESAVATDKPEAEATAETEKPASEAPEAKADGDAEAAPADEAVPAEANGTPASAKKSAKNRRVSSGATPKLNRKKSQSRITHLDAKPGQYYLARLRSYAPWPSIICDDEILPESLLEARPVTAMQKDGSYKGEYADGGRRTHERTFPVMFFATNEL